MCKICLENCQKHLSNMAEDVWYDFLMEMTCFPFGSAKQVEDQIVTWVYRPYFREE